MHTIVVRLLAIASALSVASCLGKQRDFGDELLTVTPPAPEARCAGKRSGPEREPMLSQPVPQQRHLPA